MPERHIPIVPHVVLAAPRTELYDLPPIRRAATRYQTATTLRVAGDPKDETVRLNRAWCVPTAADWQEVERLATAWREALRAFADGLRSLGSYATHLAQQGGVKQAPNPLCPIIARARNPDAGSGWAPEHDLFLLPGDQQGDRFARWHPTRHTPKRLYTDEWKDSHIDQGNAFVCQSEEDWNRINGLFAAAQTARDAFRETLQRLGTYAEALADGRHTSKEDDTMTEQEHTPDITSDPTQATLHTLPLEQLHPHPDNPRLALNEEVVAGIAAQLVERGHFSPEYALLVRPLADGYQIIAGHHRAAAARQAGLTQVPCWVRVMDDDTAYMELGLGNTQGELSPLEVGLHALGAVDLGKGGRGVAGGISAYARQIGRTQQYLSQLVAAARVYQAVKPTTQVVGFEMKARHLAEIARAPADQWAELVTHMLADDWTVEQVRAAVEERQAIPLTAEALRDLQRAVRKRGGTYDGNREINGVVTRHFVTWPGQAQRHYRTDDLREALAAFPEHEEALPADLAAAWELEETAQVRLRARHTGSSLRTEAGTIARVVRQAQALHPHCEALMAAGWTVAYNADLHLWEATHAAYGRVIGQTAETIIIRGERNADLHRVEQARAHIAAGAWDAAEETILGIADDRMREEALADFQRRYRLVQQDAQRAAWEAAAQERAVGEPPAPSAPAAAPAPAPEPATELSPPADLEPPPPADAAPVAALPSDPGAAARAQAYDRDEWYTPLELLTRARTVLGGIDLDPASSAAAQRTVQARQWFGPQEDGLQQAWHGRVWLNPPSSSPLISQFVDKALTEWEAGRVTQMLLLVNDQTDAAWYQRLAGTADALCLLQQRVRFWHPERPGEAPRQGQTMVYLGDREGLERFTQGFQAHGTIVQHLSRSVGLTRGQVVNLWNCLHGETRWQRQARATVQRLAAERNIPLPAVKTEHAV